MLAITGLRRHGLGLDESRRAMQIYSVGAMALKLVVSLCLVVGRVHKQHKLFASHNFLCTFLDTVNTWTISASADDDNDDEAYYGVYCLMQMPRGSARLHASRTNVSSSFTSNNFC